MTAPTADRVLSDAFYTKADEIAARYPVRRSALLMLLHEAQDEVGFVSDAVIEEVGAYLGLTAADVEGVATFYTMFKRRHPGKHLISVCTNLSCTVNGADATADALREKLGAPHEASADGVCSWEPVECLATCHWAVSAQIDYHDVPNLTPERATKLVDDLRAGRDLAEILAELRAPTPDAAPEAAPEAEPAEEASDG